MEFTDSYFEDEVRDGFYVPSLMKRAWAAQLEVLDGIQKVCRKYNIQYFAEWGTLLGAVRHGGMIPWDDDFDICMKSEDYNRFIAVADELPNGSFVTDYRSRETTDNMVARVENSNLVVVSKDTLENYHGFPYIAGIDIFRLDPLPANREEEEQFRQLSLGIGGVIGMIDEAEDEKQALEQDEVKRYIGKIEKICGVTIDKEKPVKTQLYYLLMEFLPSVYAEKETGELTNLPVWSDDPNYRLPKECFEEGVMLPFENTEIMVPAGYEELLQKKYGIGYMNPVRTWDSHEYPYFKKLEKYLEKNTYLEYYEYEFSREEIEKVNKAREEERNHRGESLQEKVKGFLPLFHEAHENLKTLVFEGNAEAVSELMGDCQNVAIQLGTMIEEERGEGHVTVAILEQYCELLFGIHEDFMKCVEENAVPDMDGMYRKLIAFEEELSDSIERNLKRRKEVVFVPYKVSYWDAMKSVWQAAMDDEDTDVYVIPAPYYYKDALGKVKKNEQHYETEGYPEDVVITSYEKYNFQVHHPDVIVTQCPYDEYNYAISLHPFFYAVNLKKYTDQLVYISPLVMDEMASEDDRARETLKYYCNMPGVVHADRVFVQSEQMKEVYVELLTAFAGEDTKEIWNRKISGPGAPVYDCEPEKRSRERDCLDLPEEWGQILKKPDGRFKKVILYSTSASALLFHGEKMIQKMREVFQTFSENKDRVALLWRPDPTVKKVLRKKHPELWRSYRDLVQEYKDYGWGIVDDCRDADRAVLLCDACYGDGGSIVNACRVKGKPVMLQNIV